MRAFFAISLALITGCGDNLGDGDGSAAESSDLHETDGVLDDGIVGKLVPQVCASRAWPEAIVEAQDSDIAVVEMPHGSAVLAVPRRGGDLRGFLLDARRLVIGNPEGTRILGGNFSSVSASRIEERLVVGVTDGTTASVNVLRNDLGDYRQLTSVPGSFVGDATVMHARDHRVSLTAGIGGLTLSTFDQAWTPMANEVIARATPTSLTSAQYGGDAMVAWSSAESCHLLRVAAGVHASQDIPCKNASLATNFDGNAAELVFEHDKGIWLSNIRASTHSELTNHNLLVPDATAPRAIFDGERTWVSYVNHHGDVTVGYLDEHNQLVSTAIHGTRPLNGSYDLAFIGGAIWVYAVDAETGFNASRLCLVRERR